MNYTAHKFYDEKQLLLLPLGDVHYGAVNSDFKEFLKYIEFVKRTPNARVILMGDLLEIAQKNSPGSSLFCQNATPQEQIEWGVELLKPIKDKILIMHGSNHERRVFNNSGVDITKNMARELGIAYAEYGAYTRILVGIQAYTLYSTHGKSGARTRESKMKILRNISTINVGADAYIMGHVHTNDNSINPINQLDLKAKTVSIKEIVLVLSGHFLKYNNSYAEESNMSPEPPTAPIIILDGEEHKIHVTQLADVL